MRDDEDLRRRVEYIHWNPVKHGLAVRPRDWPWSTFGLFVRRGLYPEDWGAHEPPEGAGIGAEPE